jgi:hypothetical protein
MVDENFPTIGDLTPPKRIRRKKKPNERLKLSRSQRDVFVKMGKRGGTARAAKLSAGELSDIGRKAANVRWKNKNRKKKK